MIVNMAQTYDRLAEEADWEKAAGRMRPSGSANLVRAYYDDIAPYGLLTLLTLRRQIGPCFRPIEGRIPEPIMRKPPGGDRAAGRVKC
jgi:hypothetical protein